MNTLLLVLLVTPWIVTAIVGGFLLYVRKRTVLWLAHHGRCIALARIAMSGDGMTRDDLVRASASWNDQDLAADILARLVVSGLACIRLTEGAPRYHVTDRGWRALIEAAAPHDEIEEAAAALDAWLAANPANGTHTRRPA